MRMTRKRWILITVPMVILAALFIVPQIALRDPTPRPTDPGQPPYLTLFLFDGLAQAPFQKELAAGRLPNLKRLIEQGTYVVNGIPSFPSMTGYGFYPFITGHDAASSGIHGLRWFDRQRPAGNFRTYVGTTHTHMNLDIHDKPRTSFELFFNQRSLTVNSYMNRGTACNIKTGWRNLMAKYQNTWWVPKTLGLIPVVGKYIAPSWERSEKVSFDHAIEDLANKPKVQWLTLTSLDGHHHMHGFGPRYQALLRHLDSEVGRYRAASKAAGQEKDRIYAVLSDHGMVDVAHNLDMWGHFSKAGIPSVSDKALRLGGTELEQPLGELLSQHCIVAINGNTQAHVYFQKPDEEGERRWRVPPTTAQLRNYPTQKGDKVDLVRLTLAVDGVEMVALRQPDGKVRMVTRTGEATINSTDAGLSYTIMGTDPLGYASAATTRALTDGIPRTRDQWLQETYKTEYPYAVPRIFDTLSQRGSGDLVITADAGFDFGYMYEFNIGNYVGGHGGHRADQLRVPYLLAGPGIRAGKRVEAALAEDVGATLLHLLAPGRPSVKGRRSGKVLRAALEQGVK